MRWRALSIAIAATLAHHHGRADVGTSRADLETVEVDAGTGFVRQGPNQNHPTHWVDMKIRPFQGNHRVESFGLQLGLHQSAALTRQLACTVAPSIAGRIYCGPQGEAWISDPTRFIAVFAGIHTELLRVLGREPRRPTRLHAGAGLTYMSTDRATEPGAWRPYASFEATYLLKSRIHASAGVFVTPSPAEQSLGIAMPSLRLKYLF